MKAPRNAAKQWKFVQRDSTETQYNDSEKRPKNVKPLLLFCKCCKITFQQLSKTFQD